MEKELLNELAIEMLNNAVLENGTVLRIVTFSGLTIQCGKKAYKGTNPKEEANIDYAFDLLLNNDYIKAVGHKNEVFNVTKKGFDYCEPRKELTDDEIEDLKEASRNKDAEEICNWDI